ncbi:MAG TPA: substrate-binding domain-containing protein [Thermoplasmata archaeon]|nr:substrate-binding domain-containing protein [Thermoplasmata archaeon]
MTYPTSVWVVALVVVAAAVGGIGFFAGYEYRGSPSSTPSAVENSTLSVLGAGTLDTLFPELANALVNETPGISAPPAAQTYEGSLDITTAITTGTARADVAAVADYRLIPQLLEPKYASYEVVFGSTPEVLAYKSGNPAFAGVNSTNWPSKLLNATASAPFAIWNASTDPNGYNEIFSLMLQGMLYDNGDISAVYSHFYNGAPGSYATGTGITKIEHESQAASLLSTGVVSAVITYRSYAVVNGLAYVPFNPIVGLAANNSTALADYAKLSTSIISASGGLAKVAPAPVLFAVTVPSNAPNPALGAAFIHLLLSPQGSAILADAAQGGAFTPIFPGWSDSPSAVPSVLAPDVVPLPGWAQTALS